MTVAAAGQSPGRAWCLARTLQGQGRGHFAIRQVCGCGAEVSPGSGGPASSPRTLQESGRRQEESCPLEVSVAPILAVKEVVGGPVGPRQLTYPRQKLEEPNLTLKS